MTPGPSEPTGDELQEFSRLLVNDLKKFEDEPIIVGWSAENQDGADFLTLSYHCALISLRYPAHRCRDWCCRRPPMYVQAERYS
jgi:hypothetical protein